LVLSRDDPTEGTSRPANECVMNSRLLWLRDEHEPANPAFTVTDITEDGLRFTCAGRIRHARMVGD
jgi:hypothetical protein